VIRRRSPTNVTRLACPYTYCSLNNLLTRTKNHHMQCLTHPADPPCFRVFCVRRFSGGTFRRACPAFLRGTPGKAANILLFVCPSTRRTMIESFGYYLSTGHTFTSPRKFIWIHFRNDIFLGRFRWKRGNRNF